MITLTDEQRNILGCILRDDLTPDQWLDDAITGLGEDRAAVALVSKCDRHRAEWESMGSPVY